MAKIIKFLLRHSFKLSWLLTRFTTKTTFNMTRARPYSMMAVTALGLVACSSDTVRNSADSLNPFTPKYSPYGGTEKPGAFKIGNPYTINGRTYTPRFDPDYRERGLASWYGPDFHGRQTANGERYNQDDMTAAHKTLPLPSIVRVTRTDTGKSIIVRVNDRGPFVDDRIIDLSRGSAKSLNMLGVGVAPVKVEYLPEETYHYLASNDIEIPDQMLHMRTKVAAYNADVINKVPPTYEPSADVAQTAKVPAGQWQQPAIIPSGTASVDNDGASIQISFDHIVSSYDAPERYAPKASDSASPRYSVQTGAFANPSNATRHAQTLRQVANTKVLHQNDIYRVTLGPVAAYEQALMLVDQVKEMGFEQARIVIE